MLGRKNSEQHSRKQEFDENEIVMAKITGYPYWPAFVSKVPSKKSNQYRVDFIGDNTQYQFANDSAFIPFHRIIKYAEKRDQIQNQKTIPKGLRKALQQADELLHQRQGLTEPCQTVNFPVEVAFQQQKQLLHQSQSVQEELQENQQIQQPIIEEPSKSEIEPQSEEQPIQPILCFSYSQRYQYAQNLVRKYHLQHIPKKSANEEVQKVKTKINQNMIKKLRNKKLQTKNSKRNKMSEKTISRLTSRKVYAFLKERLPSNKARSISTKLAAQILSQKQEQADYLLRMMKWVEVSNQQAIETFYESWSNYQGEKEKNSVMTCDQ